MPPQYGKAAPKESSGQVPVAASSGVIRAAPKALTGGRTIVVGRKGAVGRVQLFNKPVWPTDTTYYLQVPETLDARFMALQLEHAQLGRLDRSTAVPSLQRPDLEAVVLRVPPLPEQLRIVAAIEGAFSRLAVGDDLTVRAVRRVQLLRDAVLLSVFSSGRPAQTGDLLESVTSGSRGWAAHYSEDGPIFLRIGNVPRVGIGIDTTDVQHVQPPGGAEGRRTRVQVDDILISITADLGRIGLVPSDLGEAYVNQHLALARPAPGVNARYLAWYLASPGCRQQWSRLKRGATKIGLGLDDIRAIEVPLPSPEVQVAAVHHLESSLNGIDKLEADLKIARRRTARLRTLILAAAFSGGLVGAGSSENAA